MTCKHKTKGDGVMSERITILGKPFTILPTPATSRDAGTCGSFSEERQEITLSDSMAPEMRDAVLLHEVIEALVCMLEIDFNHRDISSLANAMYSTLPEYLRNCGKVSRYFDAINAVKVVE